MLPGTRTVLRMLRREGLDASNVYLVYVLREGLMPPPVKGPGGAFHWSNEDIARLRRILQQRKRFLHNISDPHPKLLAVAHRPLV